MISGSFKSLGEVLVVLVRCLAEDMVFVGFVQVQQNRVVVRNFQPLFMAGLWSGPAAALGATPIGKQEKTSDSRDNQ